MDRREQLQPEYF
jgi:hypothetical protein